MTKKELIGFLIAIFQNADVRVNIVDDNWESYDQDPNLVIDYTKVMERLKELQRESNNYGF